MAPRAPFSLAPNYDTKLPQMDEFQFRNWAQQNNVPFDVNAQGATDYDMRGYYRGLVNGQPMAVPTEINQNDGRPHYTDYYKTPLHASFSDASQWAGPDAPQWANDHQLASQGGRVLFDEKAAQGPFGWAPLNVMWQNGK